MLVVGPALGILITNVVPLPGMDSTSMSPLCNCTVRYTSDRPMPVPVCLVVK